MKATFHILRWLKLETVSHISVFSSFSFCLCHSTFYTNGKTTIPSMKERNLEGFHATPILLQHSQLIKFHWKLERRHTWHGAQSHLATKPVLATAFNLVCVFFNPTSTARKSERKEQTQNREGKVLQGKSRLPHATGKKLKYQFK